LLDEAIDFEAMRNGSGVAAVREFLERWPDGRHHLEAEIILSDRRVSAHESEFAEAVASFASAPLRRFLSRHPMSHHTAEITALLEERQAFEFSGEADSAEAWETYLARWPESERADVARSKLADAQAREEKDWSDAQATATASAWEDFVRRHPNSARSDEAAELLREAAAFEAAVNDGKIALAVFLRAHPGGRHAQAAEKLLRQAIERDEFSEAMAADEPEALHNFIEKYPRSERAAEALDRFAALQEISYQRLLAARDIDAAARYLATYPDSPHCTDLAQIVAIWEESEAVHKALVAAEDGRIEEARIWTARIFDQARRSEVLRNIAQQEDRLAWHHALSEGTVEAFRHYLMERPSGRWCEDAVNQIIEIERAQQEREPADWEVAWEEGSSTAWDHFLSVHPEAARLGEARRCREEAVEFETAIRLDTASLWRAFLRSWPEGRHRLEAELRLSRIDRTQNQRSARP
jgi:outer membrane protein assembly factor BamD (BamD/ComL family)